MHDNKIEHSNNTFRFDVDIYVFREKEHYISYCPSLDICSSGSDFNDAVKNFYEAFELYADYWVERNGLNWYAQTEATRCGQERVCPGPWCSRHTSKPCLNL